MFLSFFYLLKARGLKPSMNEWMTLMDALDKGLADSGLFGFYNLCRSILVTSEADFDKFDLTFTEFFDGVTADEVLAEEFLKWLSTDRLTLEDQRRFAEAMEYDLDELLKMFEERKKEQKERHDGGNYWIGTGGTSPFGNSGFSHSGILAGGPGRQGRALKVAGERNYKDFRQDNIIDVRQFQVAFRKLRNYSSKIDAAKTELDIDETVKKTSENAGLLKLSFEKPRKNTIKLLMLFDAGGSMMSYSQLTSRLFSAVSKANHFKDLKLYYFHNCVYDKLYNDPYCRTGDWVDTQYVINNLDSEYRLIIVGDAAMAPSELLMVGGNASYEFYNELPGLEWLEKLKSHYPKTIWFNPISADIWDRVYGNRTIGIVRETIPMYELSLDGLDEGIGKLLVYR